MIDLISFLAALRPLEAVALVLALVFMLTFLRFVFFPVQRSQPAGGQRRSPGTARSHKIRPDVRVNYVLVDGSNVMHWLDNSPQLAPLVHVIGFLQSQGYTPGVVFDANAGHKLFGKYLNDRDFARILSLPHEQLLVVPKGKQADPFLLQTAAEFNARIVTNDRFRDWASAHPRVLEKGVLIRGGIQEGKLWLDLPKQEVDAKAG